MSNTDIIIAFLWIGYVLNLVLLQLLTSLIMIVMDLSVGVSISMEIVVSDFKLLCLLYCL